MPDLRFVSSVLKTIAAKDLQVMHFMNVIY
jgi:hypothetical protein